jgi:VanZ family protein
MSTSGLRDKPRNTLRIITGIAAVIWAVLIFVVSAIPAEGFPSHPGFLNYLAHFGEYLILGVLLTITINSPRRALWIAAVIAVIIASLYAASDEIHQLFVAGRNSDPIDWLTDTIGALIGAAGVIWVISSRKVRRSRGKDQKLGL